MQDKFEEYLNDCTEVGEKIKSIREDERKRFINKACEWIEKNFKSDGYFSLYYLGGGIYTPKNIANDFRKAMEE